MRQEFENGKGDDKFELDIRTIYALASVQFRSAVTIR
jgi:hypothetical protein